MKQFLLIILSLFVFDHVFAQEVLLKDGVFYDAKGERYTGIYREYDAKHNLIAENNIQNGFPDGISLFYYANGVKKEQRSYKEGKKDGLWINWAENGLKTAEARFTDGKKDGFWYIWDEKGVKRYEMFYVMGEKKGNWFIWDENGILLTEQKYD